MDLLRFLKDNLFAPAENIETDTNYYISEFEWTFISPQHFFINLSTKDPKCPKITFKLAETSAKRFLRGKLNGKDVGYVRAGSNFTVQCGANVLEKHALFKHLTKAILRNSIVGKFHFRGNVYFEFVFKETPKFETFTIDSMQLTVDHMETLLDGITVNRFTSNFSDVHLQGAPKEFEMNNRNIYLQPANYLLPSSVLTSTSEKIFLFYDMEYSTELEEHFHYDIFADIVRNWARYDLKNLKVCQIQLVSFFDTELPVKVFKRLREAGLTNDEPPLGTIQRNDGKAAKLEVYPCQFMFSVID